MKPFWTGISGSGLKILAVCAMLADHFGQIVLKNGIALNAPHALLTDAEFSALLSLIEGCHIVGRVAFPIFCFLLTEGFVHTRRPVAYLRSLMTFAVLSEPFYDLAFAGTLLDMGQQNVLFELSLGLLVLLVLQKCGASPVWTAAVTLAGAILAFTLRLDGGYYGIFLIVLFDRLSSHPRLRLGAAAVTMYLCGLDFSPSGFIDPYFLAAASALVWIAAYNGRRGRQRKYFFYAFYPAHLLVLSACAFCIVRFLR